MKDNKIMQDWGVKGADKDLSKGGVDLKKAGKQQCKLTISKVSRE